MNPSARAFSARRRARCARRKATLRTSRTSNCPMRYGNSPPTYSRSIARTSARRNSRTATSSAHGARRLLRDPAPPARCPRWSVGGGGTPKSAGKRSPPGPARTSWKRQFGSRQPRSRAFVIRSVRERLKLTASIDDRGLVGGHVTRVEVWSEQLVIHFARTKKADRPRGGNQRQPNLPWRKPINAPPGALSRQGPHRTRLHRADDGLVGERLRHRTGKKTIGPLVEA